MSKYSYDFEMPAICSDTVLLYVPTHVLLSAEYYKRDIKVLLIKRAKEPYKHYWALPGGFMEIRESLEDCAIREVKEETGIILDNLMLFGMYDDPFRVPERRVLSAGFLGVLTQWQEPKPDNDETTAAKWFNLDEIGGFNFAFDHKKIIREAYEHFCKIIPI